MSLDPPRPEVPSRSRSVALRALVGLPEQIPAPELRVACDELLKGLRRWTVGGGRDHRCPAPRQALVELLWDAVVLAPLPRPLHEPLLRLLLTVPTMENPSDPDVVDVTYA